MDLFSETQTLFDQASQRLEQLNAIINAGRAQLAQLERRADLEHIDISAFERFLERPYLLKPTAGGRGDRFELIVPKFIARLAPGWPVREEGEFLVYLISRFIDFISPLPQWLREELGYQDADFQVHLDRGGCLSRRSRGSKRYLA